jgi:hypothetical protein
MRKFIYKYLKLWFSACIFSFNVCLAQSFQNVQASQNLVITNFSTDNWGSGLSFYDFNKDGWDDLTFVLENDTQAIYINQNGNFELAPFNIYKQGQNKMFLWVDFDNDSDLDIFITTKFGTIQLLENNGSFGFSDVTAFAGLALSQTNNFGASFGDYDKDGDLDLYVCKYIAIGNTPSLSLLNNLYRNNGNGTFTDVTFVAGVGNGLAPTFMSVWFDYNNDTWPDLFVINDRFAFANALYHNNGDGTFTDVAVAANLDNPFHNPMSISIADYNKDGYFDIFISNTSETGLDEPFLFRNNGNATFTNVFDSLSLYMDNTTWGGLWLDYDNDQDQDLYVATDYLDNTLPASKSYFFKNNYPLNFTENGTAILNSQAAFSHAVAKGDFDNNGYCDFAVNNDAPYFPFLYQNAGASLHFVKITLEGTASNKMAVGSLVKVCIDGICQYEYTFCGENYLGQNSQHLIFGTDSSAIVDSIVVQYLSGIKDVYYSLPVDTHYYFTEGETNSFQITVNGNLTFCNGDSLLLSAPSNASYLWNTGETSQDIWVKNSGMYYLTALDSSGIQYASNTVTLQVENPPLITATVIDVSCNDLSDGAIYLTFQNEPNFYNIVWNNLVENDSIQNLQSGSYFFEYTDLFSCSIQDTFFVNEPYNMNVQVAIQAQTDSSSGNIEFLVNGGTPPYSIIIGNDTLSQTILYLDSGNYSLLIYDAQACFYADTFFVPYIFDTLINNIHSVYEEFESFYNLNSNEFSVRFTEQVSGTCSLQFYSILGQSLFEYSFVSQSGFNQFTLNLPEHLKSHYFVTTFTNKQLSIVLNNNFLLR